MIHLLLLDRLDEFVAYRHLDDEHLVLGRGADCDFKIEDPHASREHCQLLLSEGCWRAKDLGSRHGTRLNGKAFSGSAALANLDLLTLGNHHCYVWIGDLPTAPEKEPHPFGVCQELGRPFHPGSVDEEKTRPSSHWLIQAFLDGRDAEEQRSQTEVAPEPAPEPERPARTPGHQLRIDRAVAKHKAKGKFANTCPECGDATLFGRDSRPQHGNPLSPAANAEVEVSFECVACGHEHTHLL